MTDPLNAADDGGLNPSDTLDWADEKTAGTVRTIAVYVLPGVFLLLILVAIVLYFRGNLAISPASTRTAQPVAAVTSTLSPAVANDKDAEIAHLRGQLLAIQAQSAPPAGTVATAPVYSADPSAIAQLSARLDRIEANQRALAHAAAAAHAAVALQSAASTSRPFLSELAVVEPALNDPDLLAPLRPYAEHGVPSELALAADFPGVAKVANIAAKAATGDNSLLTKLQHALGSFISIRRTDNLTGEGVEALLARAESRLDAGDLHGAVDNLNALPVPAQNAIKPWLDQARARLLVDDATQRVTEVSLNHLGQSGDDVAPATGGVL